MDKWRIKPGRPINIDWPAQPISADIYLALRDYFWASNTYGHLSVSEMQKIIENARAKAPADISLDAAFSIYHLTIKAKIMSGWRRMNNSIGRIGSAYDNGVDILILSAKYDFPPLNLLRGILLRHYSSKDIYRVFREMTSAKDILRPRDLIQFKKAAANDADSIIDAQLIADKAQENENKFIKWVQQWPARPVMRTQNDLVLEQVAEFGRAIITPDLLFDEPVFINGKRVHWIDFKSYVGCDAQFIARSNQRQVERYTQKWGPGALCFQLGFVEGHKIGDAMMLSAAELDIDFDNSLFR